MKPMNFPARKLQRKLVAERYPEYLTNADKQLIAAAREVRTKKDRSATSGKRKL